MNIAHAGRTECYCLPADVLLPLMYDLMSGRLGSAEKLAAGEKKPAGCQAHGDNARRCEVREERTGRNRPRPKPAALKPGKPAERKPADGKTKRKAEKKPGT